MDFQGRLWIVVKVMGISTVKYKLCETQRPLCQVKSHFLYLWSLLTLIKPKYFPVDQKIISLDN